MNEDQVKKIVGNETAKQIVNILAKRERISHGTDIKRFQTVMIREGYKIIPADFEGFFKSLEEIGIGNVIYNKRKVPKKFQWHYSLKDVGQAIQQPNSKIELHKLPKHHAIQTVKKPQYLKKDNETLNKQKDVVFIFTSSKGELIPFNLKDADKLLEQVSKVKETLHM